MWADSILDTIGGTPLVRLQKLGAGLPCPVLVKVEFFNPGGSVKDRIGVAMVEAAERDGRIQPGGTLIECTSGNTGAGVAIAAIVKGYRCIFTTTDKQSQEKIDVLRALGAEVLVCPTNVAPDDPRSYYSVARRLASEIPGAVLLNQYDNPANADAHLRTTGPELWSQTDGRITHFICGAGTGGTISGTAKYLKSQNPDVKVVGVDPYGSVYYKYFHEGVFDEKEIYPYLIEGVGEDILAGNMDFALVDDYVRVTDRDAMVMTRRLAREEGLFTGQSCGMALAGALQWLRDHQAELTPESVVVVLLPDSGFRYLGKTYNDAWMQQHGFLEARPALTAETVLTTSKRREPLVSAAPDDTLDSAIRAMSAHGISQMPVVGADGAPVGSLTERAILGQLLASPDARGMLVAEVMDPPFPVVPASLHLDHLTAYLDGGAGAVLVHDGDGYGILTRADLISALAQTGGRQN